MRTDDPFAERAAGGARLDRLSDYNYELPPGLIAQTPLADRAASRLLWLHRTTGVVEHRRFRDVVDILEAGDLLVMNDTRVTALRLFGRKPTGGEVELLLLRQVSPGRYQALAKPGRRLRPGATVEMENGLVASVVENLRDGLKLVQFEPVRDLSARLEEIGQTPLPPYIHERLADPERYQTVYAEAGGSAAAPTAGLHFTPELLEALCEKGVQTARVTLDVGLDTFRPVEAEELVDHKMHGETCLVPQATAEAIANCGGRIVAVGTTTVRTLETMATGRRTVRSGAETSTLFIRPANPGLQSPTRVSPTFQIIDGMFTNFHLPRTTMLMMISALAGRSAVFHAYREAVERDYRFLSFGDSMLIL